MSDWKRTTKEVPFENLTPDMVAAVNKHIELYNLGSILSDVLMCIQTDSEMVKRGLFGKAEVVRIGAVVTPSWIVWAVSGSSPGVVVLSARLKDVTVQDYAQTSFAKMIPDSGVEISGRFTDASENGSAFIGLDEGPAARKFMEMVIKASQDARK